jgi:hypothetical protein
VGTTRFGREGQIEEVEGERGRSKRYEAPCEGGGRDGRNGSGGAMLSLAAKLLSFGFSGALFFFPR